jgi:hypothetical protein
MFNPMAAVTCFLHGMTAPVEAMFDERAYNADHFRNHLMPACLNCKYIIRCIHHAMEQRQSSLRYFDLARRPPTDLTTPRPTCDNTGCKQAARREYECKNCRVAWYCSRPCRQLHWDENHPKECNCYRKCAGCGNGHGWSTCGPCLQVPGRIPARWCSTECSKRAKVEHAPWCADPAQMGPPPNVRPVEWHDSDF